MTAVDQAGTKVARYRITGKGPGLWEKVFPLQGRPVDITVNPSWELTNQQVLTIAISAGWLDRYFLYPSGGG